jgi:hypothetical protein
VLTAFGVVFYAYYYPPRSPRFIPPPGERPPLVVYAHGGPTSETTPDLKPYVQYFTTRGFAFVDVNYGGSTGYGREFRERLYGTWGVVDVRDCIAAANHLAATGRADPDRMVVTGGSASGYVVLASMAFHPRAFAAGTSYFGVADLVPFAEDTHKFELKYLDNLVGPWRSQPSCGASVPGQPGGRDRAAAPAATGTGGRGRPAFAGRDHDRGARGQPRPVRVHRVRGRAHGFAGPKTSSGRTGRAGYGGSSGSSRPMSSAAHIRHLPV